jgi:hypothetical protein
MADPVTLSGFILLFPGLHQPFFGQPIDHARDMEQIAGGQSPLVDDPVAGEAALFEQCR